MDGFADVCGRDFFGGFEVGDGAGDFADFVEGAGGEAEFFHGLFHEELGGLVEDAEAVDLGFGHGGVGGGGVAEAFALEGEGGGDLFAHGGGVGAFAGAGEVAVGDGGDFEVDIDAVEEGAGDFGDVAVDGGEFGGGCGFGVEGSGAAVGGIHGGDEHEFGGEGEGGVGAGDGDGAGFEGLAEDLEDVAGEFGELVEEEDAVVGEGDFAGARDGAAADDGGGRGGVMRRADGAGAEERLVLGEQSDGGIDAGGFEGFGAGERGEDGGEAFAEHGFAGAGGAEEQNIVARAGGDGEGAFGEFLAADFDEILMVGGGEGVDGVFLGRRGFEGELAVEKTDDFGQRADAVDFDVGHDGGLGGVVGRNDDAGNAFLGQGLSEHGDGERAFDGADAAVEGELAGDEIALGAIHRLRREDAVDGEDAQGDGEFEGVAFFFEIGGGEIDGEAAVGETVAGVEECGADAVGGFFDGGIGESDDGGFGEGFGAFGEIDFDFAGEGVDAMKDGGVEAGEHSLLRRKHEETKGRRTTKGLGGLCTKMGREMRGKFGGDKNGRWARKHRAAGRNRINHGVHGGHGGWRRPPPPTTTT